MFHLSYPGGVGWPHPAALWQDNFVPAIVLSFRYILCVTSSVRETQLGWGGSFVGRKRKRGGEQLLCASFGQFERRDRRSYKNKKLSDQILKSLFLCNLLSWTKLYIVVGPMSLFDFSDWMGSYQGRVVFCCPFSFFWHLLATIVYVLYILGVLFLALFI